MKNKKNRPATLKSFNRVHSKRRLNGQVAVSELKQLSSQLAELKEQLDVLHKKVERPSYVASLMQALVRSLVRVLVFVLTS